MIDALEEPRKVPDSWTDEYAVGERAQYEKDVKALNSLPSAERHGRWKRIIEDPPVYACTECGRTISTYNLDRYPYCHCGAKMDEVLT